MDASPPISTRRVQVTRGDRAALADERHVADLIVFADPIGNRLRKVFHGAEIDDRSVHARPRHLRLPRTGPLGMGHAVLTAERIDDVIPFYRDVLGFALSDYYLKPFGAISSTSTRATTASPSSTPARTASIT